MLPEMDLLGPADLDYGVEESSSDESTSDEEYEENVVLIHEDEIDEILSADLSNWTNMETMRSCHPMYFAKKMEESISSDNLDWMDQPSATIVIRGHLRPAFVEENTNIKKIPYSGESDNDRNSSNGAAFYKLEMISIQIVSAYGNQFTVKIQDFLEAQPDVLAHSAANILSHLKAGGEKISQALKNLCLRQKGIKVEFTVKIQDFLEAQPDVLAHSTANILSRLIAGGEKISQALKNLCLRQKGIKVEVLAAIRSDCGEQAVFETLHRARELYRNRLQADAAADELASLFAECAIAEARGPVRSSNNPPLVPLHVGPSIPLDSEGRSILAMSGRQQVMLDAFADGSSFVCLECGGLVSAHRKDEHFAYWCS